MDRQAGGGGEESLRVREREIEMLGIEEGEKIGGR